MNSHHLPASPHRLEGGIHPADGKGLSQKGTVRIAPLLEKYQLVIQQNIGAPPKLLVQKGDKVKKGQLIAEANGNISVPLHAPTSGMVGDVLDIPGANGAPVSAVELISDGQDVLIFGAPRLCISPDHFFPEEGVLALLSNFPLKETRFCRLSKVASS